MANIKSDKKTYDLVFAGMPFRLRTSHDEQTVQELAEFVDKKLQQALDATKSGSYQSAAVLAALNIAEELILLKRRALKELDRLEERATRLSENIEKSKIQKPEANA